MDVGLQLIFSSYGWDTNVTDGTVYEQELRLAELAEELGFDAVWPTDITSSIIHSAQTISNFSRSSQEGPPISNSVLPP